MSPELDEFEQMTERERLALIARLEIELLRPTREYKWPTVWEKRPEIVQAMTVAPVLVLRPKKTPSVLRSKPRKREARPIAPIPERPKVQLAPFAPIRHLSVSMPFERTAIASDQAARDRAADAL